MSRIGKAPIDIPSGVEVKIEDIEVGKFGQKVTVKGPKGQLQREIVRPIKVSIADNQVLVERKFNNPVDRSYHGLVRTLINNMIEGTTKGFEKQLELVGVGYRAALKGTNLEILVGYSKPVNVSKVEGITFEVPKPTSINVKGIDKELVGQVAANIRSIRKPEPYKGKGIKYVDEVIRRKAGKTAKASG